MISLSVRVAGTLLGAALIATPSVAKNPMVGGAAMYQTRNIVENAFIHAPGPTHVHLEVSQGRAVLQVMDRGPGIPDAAKDKVFQRFARADTRQPGTGLGLAIARDIAVAFGGAISVADRLGGGLVVAVGLPLVAKDEEV